jgi:hypothetical protein
MCIWPTVLGATAVVGFVAIVAGVWTYEQRASDPVGDSEPD